MERKSELNSSEAKVYAITSGKGGVGKTSIAINLSLTLSKAGMKVLLIDSDVGLANVDLMTGVLAPHTIEEVIEERANIFEALADGPENLTILSAGSGIGRMDEMGEERILHFRKELLKLENAFDIIFIDTGAGISTNVMNFVFMADEVIVVMTPEPTAFADAYAVVKVVSMEKPVLRIGVIINMSKNEEKSRVIFSKFKEIVKKFLGKEIIYHGAIVFDSVVTESIMRQIPLALYAGKSAAMQSVRQIARHLLGLEYSKPKTIFNR
jgi:flagellar biosynthesis protein FlhG